MQLTSLENTGDNFTGDYPNYYYTYPNTYSPEHYTPLYPVWWWDTNTYTINVNCNVDVFNKVGNEYRLVIDSPGFGKEGDSLEVLVEDSRLKVVKNRCTYKYEIPAQLNIDTLKAVVEYGQIIITAECKSAKNIPVEIRR